MKRSRAVAALGLALASMATAQVAILQIQVIEGEGGVFAPGARSTHPLTVEVTDETGRPVPGAAVNFHLPEDGPSGAFANGLRTEVATTDERGHATLRGLQMNRVPGRLQIRITASKEQARAGIVSFQYIADPASGTPLGASGHTGGKQAAVRSGGSHGHKKKWIIILAGVGVGAAAGLKFTHSGSASSSSSSAAAGSPTIITTIGTPTITVSKP
ncbi:MAG: hypothetical protein JO323_02970 [Acidobacteriia bacterium]|nr:hypothetical protein [Terriglobia bacterium]